MSPLSAKSWCATINNPSDEEKEIIKNIECTRIICGEEVSDSGTPHLQLAITFQRNKRGRAVKAALGGRAHVEKMRGSWGCNVQYCSKQGNVLRKKGGSGEGNAGRRTDLEEFREKLESNQPDLEMVKSYPMQCAMYPRFWMKLKELYARERSRGWRGVRTTVLWGEPGAGKTRQVMEMEGVYKWNGFHESNVWWDGYEGEKKLLIDDFQPMGLSHGTMLALLDGYELRLPIKMGHTWAEWTEIWITSNSHPAEWYSEIFEGGPLQRRIQEIREVIK